MTSVIILLYIVDIYFMLQLEDKEEMLFLVDKMVGAVATLPLMVVFLAIFDKKRFVKKWFWVVLFALYMNAMMVIVGVPSYGYIRWNPEINFIPFQDFSSSNILGMILNICMFVPFGAFLPIYFKKFRKLLPTVTTGLLTSLTIEVLQLFCFRATDIDDLLMNTVGTLIGFFIGKLIVSINKKEEQCDKDIIKMVALIVISILVVVFLFEPLMNIVISLLG